MSLFKYFDDLGHARIFRRKGVMRFGSLNHYREIEDGGVRGDPHDGMLHYAPRGGFEVARVADGMKLEGVAFTTAAQNMFVYCVSNDLSEGLALEFGRFCVEILDPDALQRRLIARAYEGSRLDFANVFYGAAHYRPLDDIPGVDWAFPERIVLIKPPEYAAQNETRFVLPVKQNAHSEQRHVMVSVGNIEEMTKLHVF